VGTFQTLFRGAESVVRLQRRLRGPLRPTWSTRFETFATMMHLYSKRSRWVPLAYQRRSLGSFVPRSRVVSETMYEPVRAGGVPAEWFRRPETDPTRVLLYFHGGGYAIGSIDSHRDAIARMCRAGGVTGLALDYRLAPEHPFPAQLEDAVAAYHWLLAQGIDPARVVIGGESAGGGLTLSTLVKLRDDGVPLPAAGLCLSPWVDLEMRGGSLATNERFDFVSRPVLELYARRFVGDGDRRNPLAAPIHADLTGLPPLLVHAGGAEVLLDDALQLATRARAAGVDVDLEVWADMNHAWHLFAAWVPEGREAIARIGAFIRARTGS
jgi:acetyl esterase/lipase